MRFENGLETLPPLPPHPARARTADTDVVNSDTYNADLKLVLSARGKARGCAAKLPEVYLSINDTTHSPPSSGRYSLLQPQLRELSAAFQML